MNKKMIAALGGVVGAIALIAGAQAYVSYAAAKEVDQAIEGISEFVSVDYRKVSASLLGGGTHVKDIVVTPVGSGEQYKLNEVVVYDYDQTADEVPTHINLAVNGMALDPASMGASASSLKEFGYDEALWVDFATEYQYQEDDQEVRLKQFKVGAKDVGDLDVSLHLSNISLDPATVASMPFSLFGLVLNQAKITYDDDSLVTRMFDTAAKAKGVSVAAVKKEAIARLEADLASGEASLTQELVAEMKNFINDPSGFSLSMSPAQPVPLSDLMTTGGDPDKIIELLNVRFES